MISGDLPTRLPPSTSAPFDLDRLLGPIGVKAFFADYWEKRHLHIARGDPACYDALIGASDLAALVADRESRYPSVRLAQGGGFFPPEAYTFNLRHGDETFGGMPDVARIKEAYRNGATVVLPAVDRRQAALGALCQRLETELSHVVDTNAYITPGNTSGFTPHYDTHEVFVLQIAGSKHWRLYPGPLHLPHRNQTCTPQAIAGLDHTVELTLGPGDLLYLPRGTVHAAHTTDSFSAHVSIGVTMYTAVELLQDLLHEATRHPALRASLPIGFANGSECQPALHERLLQALDILRAELDPTPRVERFATRVRASHRKAPERFDLEMHVIGSRTRLRTPPPGTWRFIEAAPGVRTLEFSRQRFRCPQALVPSMSLMLEREIFCLDDLAVSIDSHLVLGLIKELHAIGFLRISRRADESAASPTASG